MRTNWAGCACPDGARYVSTRGRTRGWSCVKNTPKGSRFVKAVCKVGGAGANLLSAGEDGPARNAIVRRQRDSLARQRAVEAEAILAPRDVLIVESGPLAPPPRPKKARSKGKVDWSRCKCPPGATLQTTKKGQVCKQKNKFVKAVCP